MTQSATHHWLSIDCWTCELRSDKNSYRRPCSVDRTVGDAPSMFVCDGLQHGRIRRTEENRKKLIVRSVISEAETTNNKTAIDVLYWSYTDTKHRAASLRQQSFLFSKMRFLVRFGFGSIPISNNLDSLPACDGRTDGHAACIAKSRSSVA